MSTRKPRRTTSKAAQPRSAKAGVQQFAKRFYKKHGALMSKLSRA